MIKLRRLAFAGLSALAVSSFAFACSLDLDEALIGKGREGGTGTIPDANLPDGTIITESGVPIIPDAGTCSKDEECVSANGCLKGKCDLTRRACAYDICHSQACKVSTCDQAAKTCSPAQDYKRVSPAILLEEVTSGGIIAAYPWVFQMTGTGVLVYDVSNPTKTKPTPIPLTGLGFLPAGRQFVRSGNRIWIISAIAGKPARLPVAYIDIPADPFSPRIEARTILLGYSRPEGEGVGLFPADNKGALLVGPTPTFATAQLDTLLVEPATRTATPFTAIADTYPIGVSGTRLVMQQLTQPSPGVFQAQGSFSLVNGAGTTNPLPQPLVTNAEITAAGASNSRGILTSLDGTVFLFTGLFGPNPVPEGPVLTKSSKAYILLADGNAALSPDTTGVDLEVYPADGTGPVANATVLAGITMFDADTAVVGVLPAENLAGFALDFVKKDKNVLKEKRTLVPIPIASVAGISASDGFVYVAANVVEGEGDTAKTVPKLFVIDPGCAP